MTERVAEIFFEFSWGLLLFIAVLAMILFEDQPKRNAGFIINLLVVTPFVVVFTLFYLERYFGNYESGIATQIAGTVITVLGMICYIISHFYLQKNWSIMASVKKRHQLVESGPYKFVRHPMYSSMIMVVLGSGFLLANYMIIIFTPLAGIIYYLRARKEEELLKEEFPEYDRYSKKTKMLIPGIL